MSDIRKIIAENDAACAPFLSHLPSYAWTEQDERIARLERARVHVLSDRESEHAGDELQQAAE